jgi:hypothetical protein
MKILDGVDLIGYPQGYERVYKLREVRKSTN